MVATCPSCRTVLTGSNFCTTCGFRLHEVPARREARWWEWILFFRDFSTPMRLWQRGLGCSLFVMIGLLAVMTYFALAGGMRP